MTTLSLNGNVVVVVGGGGGDGGGGRYRKKTQFGFLQLQAVLWDR